MPFKRIMKGLPLQSLPAKGLLYQDWPGLTNCQRECTRRMGMTIQVEQEAYLSQHPEVKAMLEIFISKMIRSAKKKDLLKKTAEHFTRPASELEEEIKEKLCMQQNGIWTVSDKRSFHYNDINMENEIKSIIRSYYPPESWHIPSTVASTPNTLSSSFISKITSDTTLPTPEPIPTPEPTISETFFALISNTIDKAIYLHVNERALIYDTAYMELSKAVEEAMEIPVIDIKGDIAELFYNAYKMFELDIMEKEKIAADIAWEKRMRKKMKRTLRQLNNFKGYETPPTPKSDISSHESYKKPPPRPCACHPRSTYNRYPKDRFGIYLPRNVDFSNKNVTATPAISIEDFDAEQDDEKVIDTKSTASKKSVASRKSDGSRKTTYAD